MAAGNKCCSRLWHGMTRRKTLESDMMATPLKRCLKWWHLTMFGIGQMAGAGVYVLTGTVARTLAGPATFISYIIAGLCAIFAALCYAEFGARCPRAGSAYTYSYWTIGELVGFSIGWNLLLEHCIGGASTARAWGSALDSLLDNAVRNWTVENVGTVTMFGHQYTPDLVSVLVIIVVTCFLLYGAELSMSVTAVISTINAVTTVLIVVLGLSIGNIQNWSEPGGFAPFGVAGVVSGSSMLFYAYVGFDAIAMAGEEAENPAKSLPIANLLSISIVMTMYVSMSIALTIAVPYDVIDPNAAFSEAFRTSGVPWARILVNVVMLLVIQGSTISALYAGPRCAYSMASDGLLLRCLAYVHPWTRTPVLSILTISTIAALTAVLLDVETLAEFVSLGTLMASLVVSCCLIILRYQPEYDQGQPRAGEGQPRAGEGQPRAGEGQPRAREGQPRAGEGQPRAGEGQPLTQTSVTGTPKPSFSHVKWLTSQTPGRVPKYSAISLCLLLLMCAGFGLLPAKFSWWSVSGLVLSTAGAIWCFVLIIMHEQTATATTFQIPCVPLLPSISMLVISCLLVKLSVMAWVRFAVWMTVGFIIYFGYGIRHSNENVTQRNDYVTLPGRSPTGSDVGETPRDVTESPQ